MAGTDAQLTYAMRYQAKTCRKSLTCASSARGGFTLVEMLVVIGIITLLIAILLPAINRAYLASVRTKMAADIQALAAGLEAYRQDHGDIPRTSPDGSAVTTFNAASRPAGLNAGYFGAQILCRALLGPGDINNDGAAGNGFRTVVPITTGGNTTQQGKVYGPYITPDRFKLVSAAAGFPGINPSTSPPTAMNNCLLADRNGKPFAYYPGNKLADPTVAYATSLNWGSQNSTSPPTAIPMFNVNDNSNIISRQNLQLILGDNNLNGKIDPGAETPQFTGEYLLIGAGPDERFGPPSTAVPISSGNQCDDVTNYGR